MAADAARGLAAAARPVLGRPTCRASTGTRSARRYEPLLDRVATRGELSDLIWEMQGELGTSHAYEMGGDHRKPPVGRARPPRRATSTLGRRRTAARSRASSRGDAWDASADSPLNAVGVEAQVGERIVAVNGQPVSARAAAAGAARPPGRARRSSSRSPQRTGSGATRTRARHRRSPTKCRRATASGSSSNRAWVHEQSDGTRRLLPPARHDVGGLRRVPPLLQHRVRPRRADRRRPLQPRRPRVAAAAREGRAQAHRLCDSARWMRPSPYPDESSPGRSSR